MKKITQTAVLTLVSIIIISLSACGRKNTGLVTTATKQPSGTVAISLKYRARNTYSSNQFAIWIEDMNGNFIKTVYATSFSANGGYKERKEAVPIWVERSKISTASQKEIDAISGPTPKSGTLMYIWDLTDESGQPVPSGKYRFYVEATVYKESRVLLSNIVDISGKDTTVNADPNYTTDLAKEEAIITDVTASWKSK